MSSTLSPYAVLEITGNDAGAFLRGQLTNDVLRLGRDRHFLAAWCDAKGRTLCIMRVLESDAGYLLLLPASLLEPIVKRLRMYVLRAQVKIDDVTGAWHLAGMRDTTEPLPDDATVVRDAGRILLGLGTSAAPRALLLQNAEDSTGTPASVALDSAEWRLAEIDAGVPEVDTATHGLFVPQMLNLHWLLAVDFDKGCYPGQEIVARLHYRGRLTRRLFRMQWDGQQDDDRPAPGDDVVDDGQARQGTVLQAAEAASGQGRLLAVLRVDAARQPLRAGNATLERLDLPYATPD